MSIKHVSFDDSGFLAFSSVIASYRTVLTLTDDADVLFVFNTLDQTVQLSIPSKTETGKGVSNKDIRLPANQCFVFDCRTNSKRIPRGVIQVRHVGVAPTSGEITVTAAR